MIGRVGLVEDAADFVAVEKLGPDALMKAFLRLLLETFRPAREGLARYL
jgi:hypothetical protein